MSIATALVANNCTLGNDSKLLNHMCVLVIARGNSTLFDATSIQDVDIIELCVEVGEAHPKGMLWLLAIELVIFFQSSEEMLATACRVTKAMA